MIPIFVWGIPAAYGQEKLEGLLADLQKAAAGISELSVKPEEVVVFFPSDRCSKGLGEELIVNIDLDNTHKLTGRLQQKLREDCIAAIRIRFRTAHIQAKTNETCVVWSVTEGPAEAVTGDPECGVCPICHAGMLKNTEKTMRVCPNCGEERAFCIN